MKQAAVLWILALCLLALPAEAARNKAEKRTVEYDSRQRSYYLYTPKDLEAGKPAPALVLLHGSGRDGTSLVEPWRKLADREGLILIAPDALDPSSWNSQADSPDFLKKVIDDTAEAATLDRERLYLFGHSAGANYALMLVMVLDDLFAAVAVHAGKIHPDDEPWIRQPERKTPISIQVGAQDPYFSVESVRRTQAALEAGGFEAELVEIPRHDHWYYDRAPKINDRAWEFLRRFVLR